MRLLLMANLLLMTIASSGNDRWMISYAAYYLSVSHHPLAPLFDRREDLIDPLPS